MEGISEAACYQALTTRDGRFDGALFVGVLSTGIYCRPVCPARTPKPENCRFFPSAAAAHLAGFRPCLRCRPETAPNLPAWLGTSTTVRRALALISEGALDGDRDVPELAERLGVGERQLRRLFQQHLGASPGAVAQTRRVLFAKQLLHQTQLPIAAVAISAGFGSVRRFNELWIELFGRPPGALRRQRQSSSAAAPIQIDLRYRPPYDWLAMLAYLETRSVTGLDLVSNGRYQRALPYGSLTVQHLPARDSLRLEIQLSSADGVHGLRELVSKVRRVFDLDADVEAINAQLSNDNLLAPLIASRPGLRVPSAWSGFEVAIRAVLGQQISVAAARLLASQLIQLCGGFTAGPDGLNRQFPGPRKVLGADLAKLGMPATRRRSLLALAEAAHTDPLLFDGSQSSENKLKTIYGIGPWTAEYIRLRAGGDPDAFPTADGALLRNAGRLAGETFTSQQLLARSESWRPWRSYAAQHIWMEGN